MLAMMSSAAVAAVAEIRLGGGGGRKSGMAVGPVGSSLVPCLVARAL